MSLMRSWMMLHFGRRDTFSVSRAHVALFQDWFNSFKLTAACNWWHTHTLMYTKCFAVKHTGGHRCSFWIWVAHVGTENIKWSGWRGCSVGSTSLVPTGRNHTAMVYIECDVSKNQEWSISAIYDSTDCILWTAGCTCVEIYERITFNHNVDCFSTKPKVFWSSTQSEKP